MKRWAAAFAEDIRRRRAAGISAAGERPDSFLFAIDMRGPEQFRILADKLAARGHSQRRIEKILGLNFLAYSRRIWRSEEHTSEIPSLMRISYDVFCLTKNNKHTKTPD